MRRAEDRPETAVEEVRPKFTISPLFYRVQRSREILRIVTSNPHCVGFCRDIVRICQFTCCSPNSQRCPCLFQYCNTNGCISYHRMLTGFIITKSPFFANTLVMQSDRRACECEISLVYLVKFQSALFSLVFLMHHLCREENVESPF